jgi:hypothetical protein
VRDVQENTLIRREKKEKMKKQEEMLSMTGRLLIGDVLYHGTQKLASQKQTIPTSVEPFQYSLNSAVLCSQDSFRFICASISQVAFFRKLSNQMSVSYFALTRQLSMKTSNT